MRGEAAGGSHLHSHAWLGKGALARRMGELLGPGVCIEHFQLQLDVSFFPLPENHHVLLSCPSFSWSVIFWMRNPVFLGTVFPARGRH